MHHLSDRELVGLCYRTLNERAMLAAAAHLSWCEPCRKRAESLDTTVSSLDSWKAPALSAKLTEAAIQAATQRRLDNRALQQVARASGVKSGDSYRSARLLVTSLATLMVVLVGIGALWKYLAESWEVESEITISAPSVLYTGGDTTISVKVTSQDPKTRIEGIPVSLQLQQKDSEEGSTQQESTTGPGGIAIFSLSVPNLKQTANATLTANATVGGEPRETRINITVQKEAKLHLSSDKPTYQPGQLVHLRALALNRGDGLPAAGSNARIEIFDPRGTRISREDSEISKQGVAATTFEISPEAALGDYRAVLTVDGYAQTRSFKVERYTLPPFSVAVKPLVPSTDGKTPFEIEVSAKYSFGEPVSSGKVRMEVTYYGSWITSVEAPIKNGVATVKVTTLPPWVAEQARFNGGVLSFRATVIDPAARAEEGSGALALTRDTLLVDLHSEARSLRNDLPVPNKILIRTTRPDGSPVSAKVQVLSPDLGEESIVGKGELVGELETDAQGIGRLDLPPAFFGRQLATLVTDPKDNHKLWRSFAAPPIRLGSSILRCDRALLRAGQEIVCDVYHPDKDAKLVRADLNGVSVAMGVTSAERGVSSVKLVTPKNVAGLLRIWVEGAPYEDATYALVSPAEGLQVSIAGQIPEQPKPGDEAQLEIKVTDDAGNPKVAAIGLALVDAAVFARTGGETPRQVIEALFASPGLAPEMMALLFPSEPLGKEGSQDNWTLQQQVNARWLLSTADTSPAPLSQDSSYSRDSAALQEARQDARGFYRWSTDWATVVLFLVVLLILVVYSFWVRAAVFGAFVALPAFFVAAILFDEVLDFDRDMAQLLSVLVGFSVLALIVWWRARMRPDPFGPAKSPEQLVADRRNLLILSGLSIASVFLGMMTMTGYKMSPARVYQEMTAGGDKGYAYDMPAPPPMVVTAQPTSLSAAAIPMPTPASPEPEAPRRSKSQSGLYAMKDASDEEREGDANAGPGGGMPSNGSGVRVRKEFPETLYYNPGLVTNEQGRASASFRVADSITTWTLYALATDAKGAVGQTEGGVEVFQDFFVDVEVPTHLTVGDELALQVAVYNYQKTAIEVTLTPKEISPGFTINAAALAAPIKVAPNSVAGVLLPTKIEAAGVLSLTLQGDANGKSDAIRREVTVVPDGREVREVFSGIAIDEVKRNLNIPEGASSQGQKIEMTLFASPLAVAFDGLEKNLAEPHGCFEQVSSTTYPNALILKALKATGNTDKDIEARALRYLRLGYQQILPYEIQGGGFSYFGEGQPVPYLTAYALQELTEMSSLIDVDPELIARQRNTLASIFEQNASFGGPAQAAYITLALVESDPNWNAKEDPQKPWDYTTRRTRGVTKQALEKLVTTFSVTESLDTYAMALAANAFLAAGDKYRDQGLSLLADISGRAQTLPAEGGKTRVVYSSRSTTLYGSYGSAADVETTALVAHAYLRSQERPDKAKEAFRALLSMRDSYTQSFYSTQGTILALRALLAAAQTETVNGKGLLLVDGVEVAQVEFNTKNAHLPQTIDLTGKVQPNSLITLAAGEWTALATDVSYRLSVRYYMPWELPAAPPIETIGESDPKLSLKVSINKTQFRLGDIGTVTAKLSRQGGPSTRGMILVELGLPPGFKMTPDAMSYLQQYPVKRVEQRARGVVLYLDDPGAGAELTFQMPIVASRGVTRVLLPRSRGYFYYQPWIESLAAPIKLNVSPK